MSPTGRFGKESRYSHIRSVCRAGLAIIETHVGMTRCGRSRSLGPRERPRDVLERRAEASEPGRRSRLRDGRSRSAGPPDHSDDRALHVAGRTRLNDRRELGPCGHVPRVASRGACIARVRRTDLGDGDTRVFALVVLPTLFALGIFTFVRLVERPSRTSTTGVRSTESGATTSEQAGPEARWFMLAGHDDAPGVLRNMGSTPTGRQYYFTASSAIAVVNSVVGGAARDRVLGRVRCVPGASAVMKWDFRPTVITHLRWSRRRLEAGVPADVLFPSAST